jgi:hypothetical protein
MGTVNKLHLSRTMLTKMYHCGFLSYLPRITVRDKLQQVSRRITLDSRLRGNDILRYLFAGVY